MAQWILMTDPLTGKPEHRMNHQVYYCSDCKTYRLYDADAKVGVTIFSNKLKWCPFCGARMLQQQEKKSVL